MKVFLNYMAMYNYGCEAILRGTVKILSNVFGRDVTITMPSWEIAYTRRRLADLGNVAVIPLSIVRRVTRKALRMLHWPGWYKIPILRPTPLAHADCALSVGGDLYTLDCTGDIPWELLGIGAYCRGRNIPYIIWGATVGPFEKRPERLGIILSHLETTDLILARDRRSVSYLEERSIASNVRQVADPAFWLEPEEFDMDSFLPRSRGNILIGVNFSPIAAARYYAGGSEFIREIVRTCEMLIDQYKASILLVPHVISPFAYKAYDDREFHTNVYNCIPQDLRPRVSVVSEDIGAARMKYIISKLDYFAGARMHSTIAALSTGVPTISLAYSTKGEALNELIFGHTEWTIRIPEFTAEAMCEKISRLRSERENVIGQLGEEIPKLRAQSMKAGHYVKQLMT